jgi:hypothetical protein
LDALINIRMEDHACDPAPRRQRQEDFNFKVILGYIPKPVSIF